MVAVSRIIALLIAGLLAAAASRAQANTLLLGTCKSVGGGSKYVGIQFCMDAFSNDGRSLNASSYKDFAVIAVDLLTANATSTKSKIDGLLQQGGGGASSATTRCVQSCQALYGGVLHRQPAVAAALKSDKLREAIASLEQSASAAQECENGFKNSKVASPVTVEDADAFQLAKLAVGLLLLQPSP